MTYSLALLSLLFALSVAEAATTAVTATAAPVPSDFVDIKSLNPNIQVEMRYFLDWNFVGRKLDGYNANRCFLTIAAAQALSKVQTDLERKGLSLLIFDCYRPQRTVTQLLGWTKDTKDNKMQAIFYPDEPKNTLVRRGYIASKSGHSRGSTVDLTLIHFSDRGRDTYQEERKDCRQQENIEKTGQLDMATIYDCFSVVSNTDHPDITASAKEYRDLLRSTMETYGFKNYAKEWWHFTLKNEPYRNTYFDFVVE